MIDGGDKCSAPTLLNRETRAPVVAVLLPKFLLWNFPPGCSLLDIHDRQCISGIDLAFGP